LRQPIVASEWTPKKTAVPSIVACESVATQLPSSVDFVGPQLARHNIIASKESTLSILKFLLYKLFSILKMCIYFQQDMPTRQLKKIMTNVD
jgi:hypothetical protein